MLVLTCSLTFYFSVDVMAQESNNRFGIKAGYSLGSLLMDPDPAIDGHTMTSGYLFGFSLERHIRGKVTFAPEIFLIKNGDKFTHLDSENSTQNRTSEFSETYLMIPILYKYYFNGFSDRSFLSFGPEVSFILKSEIKPNVTSNSGSDNAKWLKFSTFAVTLGAGFEKDMPNSPLTLVTEVRYSRGLQNFNKNNPQFSAVKFNYQVFQLSLGLKF
ncbi:outer membrane beta-barrel protein [candidate division KSB1 bacterium]